MDVFSLEDDDYGNMFITQEDKPNNGISEGSEVGENSEMFGFDVMYMMADGSSVEGFTVTYNLNIQIFWMMIYWILKIRKGKLIVT